MLSITNETILQATTIKKDKRTHACTSTYTSKQKQQRSGTVLSNHYPKGNHLSSERRTNHSMQEIFDLSEEDDVKGLIKVLSRTALKKIQDLCFCKTQLNGRSLVALHQLCTSASS